MDNGFLLLVGGAGPGLDGPLSDFLFVFVFVFVDRGCLVLSFGFWFGCLSMV